MRHTFMRIMLGGVLTAALLDAPARAQTPADARQEPGQAAADVASVRDCRPPADAKEAQVLTFDENNLEAKLAVNLGKGEFKVVTLRLWDRPEDPRPVVPVIEAARIMQGKVQFYTPDLNTDPQSVHDKQFLLMTEMGGGYICWATPSSLVSEGAYRAVGEPKPEATPAPETTPADTKPTSRRKRG